MGIEKKYHKKTILQVVPALISGGVERGTLEIAKKIVDGEFEPIKDDGFYSPMLVQIVNICMSAD